MTKRKKTLAEEYTTLKRGAAAVAVFHAAVGLGYVLLATLGYGSGLYLWLYLVLGVLWIAMSGVWTCLSRKNGQTAEKMKELGW